LGIGSNTERNFSETELDDLMEVGRALAEHFLLVPHTSAA
jgi:hypothetical protein